VPTENPSFSVAHGHACQTFSHSPVKEAAELPIMMPVIRRFRKSPGQSRTSRRGRLSPQEKRAEQDTDDLEGEVAMAAMAASSPSAPRKKEK
jgi:hypothetical protein